jgi:succinate dehydrogenase / fumarate reductase iron-sulfur subunit
MDLKLHLWRQKGSAAPGRMVPYEIKDVSADSSFLEMLDLLNEGLIEKGEEPVAFDSDCREGICGMCSLVINGVPHGPERETTVCQGSSPGGRGPSRSCATCWWTGPPSTASWPPAASSR